MSYIVAYNRVFLIDAEKPTYVPIENIFFREDKDQDVVHVLLNIEGTCCYYDYGKPVDVSPGHVLVYEDTSTGIVYTLLILEDEYFYYDSVQNTFRKFDGVESEQFYPELFSFWDFVNDVRCPEGLRAFLMDELQPFK